MGYTTEFDGEFKFSRPLTIEEKHELDTNVCNQDRRQHPLKLGHDYLAGKDYGFWCDWEVNDAGTCLKWNGGEKFYNYTHWLKYLIEAYFKPWGVVLNGFVTWSGEDDDDRGIITVIDNEITVEKLKSIVYREVGENEWN